MDYTIFQMCKSTGQSREYVEENFTIEEITLWFCFETYDGYVQRKMMEPRK